MGRAEQTTWRGSINDQELREVDKDEAFKQFLKDAKR